MTQCRVQVVLNSNRTTIPQGTAWVIPRATPEKHRRRRYKVEAMPTFIFFAEGEQVDEMTGAKDTDLKAKVAALAAK